MAAAPNVDTAFSPLDEELELLPGSYTPQMQETMTRLGAKMAYEQAQEEMRLSNHTVVSESTIRRQTMENGQASEGQSR